MTRGNLATLKSPAGWRWAPLWSVAPRIKVTGQPYAEPLSVFLGAGVVPRSSRQDNHNSLGDDLSKYLLVASGDLVFNKLRTWQGGFGVSEFSGIVSPAYYVCRPSPNTHPRFLHHLLRSSPYLAELTRLSKFMPPSQFDMPWDDLRALPLLLPPLDEQRRIADFLDAETARIDGLLELRRRQMQALAEKKSLLFEAAVARHDVTLPATLVPDADAWRLPDGWLVTSLSRLLNRLTNGYVGPTRDILEDDGVRYIQGLHIKGGEIDFDRRPFFVSAAWHRERPRINLRQGDVLIVQTGDIGQVAVVPSNFGEASCHALLIARVRKELITGEYLSAYLRSHFGYRSLLSRATGALHPHLEGGIRDVPVLVPPLPLQSPLVDEVAAGSSKIKGMEARVQRQIELLGERRAALITVAVTGQLDVTTASGAA